jgi:hypothetical protein
MTDQSVLPYVELIRRFVDGRISASTFESDYLRMFKNEKTFFAPHVFEVLDELFADVDAFCPDPALRSEGDLSEEQLRVKCAEVLNKLGYVGNRTAQ